MLRTGIWLTFHLHFKNFTHYVTQYTFDNFASDKTKTK